MFMMEKLVRESISFERGISPKKAMDIGMGNIWIYDIETYDDGGYSFRTNNKEIMHWIKSVIPNISDNEIDRFMAFTMQDIYDKLPDYLLDKKAEKELTDIIKNEIRGYSSSWMGIHSDKAMRSFNRNL
jgi:methionyl-tRNA synthetase